MREIKFQGKVKKHCAEEEPKTSLLDILLPKPKEDRDEGVWVYGSYVDSGGGKHWIIDHKDSDCILVDPKTVGQFTGRQDKNGEEIWEDDIVKNEYEKKPVVVKFGEGFQGEPADGMYPYWGWYTDGWIDRFAFDGDDLEIIGNVHDNPDLLEEK